MAFHIKALRLIFLLLALPGWLQAAALESDRQQAGVLFDGGVAAPAPPSPGLKDSKTDFLLEMKQVLSAGTWNGSIPETRHFIFKHAEEGWTAQAQSVGLEGFLWTKKELEGKYGERAFSGQLDDYFSYLDALLAPVAWTGELREALADLRAAPLDFHQKNARLNAILENYVSGLQENMRRYDKAAWAKKARIYEIFPRAYNLSGRRDARAPYGDGFFKNFKASDFDAIKTMGFDTVWPMGILPVGVRGQTGSGGGSVYSISDHSTVNPDLGSEEDFRRFVRLAHQAGLRVIVDFVVNHTSLDSKLLAEDPAFFVSHRTDAACPNDYFESWKNNSKYCVHHGGFEYGGGVSSWIDTAQINYANPALRARMTEIVKGWVTKFDVDGFRVDMAYLALNNVFSRTWQKSMPPGEFYRGLIGAVKAVKPDAAFMAEAYAYQEDLSACGFDTIYSKHEEARPEGQTGWYNATEHGNNWQVQSALNRNAFLAWQTGGAGTVMFVGNHDEAAPERVYGERLPAALALTMLSAGSVMVYSGAEIGYDAHVPGGEQKPLPFSIPCQIDWKGGDPQVKRTYEEIFGLSERLRSELGNYVMEPLWAPGGQSWAGYIMRSTDKPGLRMAVIGNVSHGATSVTLPAAGFNGYLSPGEYRVLSLP